MNIINTLTGNVNTNDNLVDQVLALITDLKRQQAEQGLETGANQELIKVLQKQIETLQEELDAYRARLATANDTLESTITKMRNAIARPPAPALPDGKRRSRKRNSRKRKSRRSRKSKKRHY